MNTNEQGLPRSLWKVGGGVGCIQIDFFPLLMENFPITDLYMSLMCAKK